jgi:hypothetical protein
VCALLPFAAAGQEAGAAVRLWSVAPYIGMFQPELEALNEQEFRAPYEGTAQFTDPVANNSEGTFSYSTPLPEFSPGTLTGLEFTRQINERHFLLMGAATWEASSTAVSTGLFPIQGDFESVNATRKAKLSYNEFYLGWRYNFLSRPSAYRFYFAASLHHLYDIDYSEEFTGVFLCGDIRSFRKSLIIRAQATGLPLLEGKAGGEWFVTDWLSLGIEGGYDIGLKEIELVAVGRSPITSDFLATDNVQVFPPMRMDLTTRRMIHKSVAGGDYETTRLDFSGWKLLMKATLYF